MSVAFFNSRGLIHCEFVPPSLASARLQLDHFTLKYLITFRKERERKKSQAKLISITRMVSPVPQHFCLKIDHGKAEGDTGRAAF